MRTGFEGGGKEAGSSSILEDIVGIYGCEITSYGPQPDSRSGANFKECALYTICKQGIYASLILRMNTQSRFCLSLLFFK